MKALPLSGRGRTACRLPPQVGHEADREKCQGKFNERSLDDESDAATEAQGDRQGRRYLRFGAQPSARSPIPKHGSEEAVLPQASVEPGATPRKAPGCDKQERGAGYKR